jgi:hypothetical protein
MVSGMIPANELVLLRELKNLFLQENRLQRKIPTKLLSKMKLEELCLESNQLTGPIPDDVGLLQETIVFLASLTNSFTHAGKTMQETHAWDDETFDDID